MPTTMRRLAPIAWLLLMPGLTSARGGGTIVEVSYPPSKEPGELAYGVTYRAWIPDGVERLRGMIVHQHGCGAGACKGGQTAADDLQWQALARKWDCALLGPSYQQPDGQDCRAWCDPRRGSRARFLRALDDLASRSGHPELSTVPWCLWGHSGGGFWTSLMMASDPDRIVAAWLRSGTAFAVWEKGEIPKPELREAVYRIPTMCNPGAKERDDKRFKGAWDGAMAMFRAYRAKGAPIGFAPDPRTAHECGDSRLLAIPFFDACLAARLPDEGTDPTRLKPVDGSRVWLAPVLGQEAMAASSYKGKEAESVWLPDERVARAWAEYVRTGAVGDPTPPPAPTGVKLDGIKAGGVEVTWGADSDLESGLRQFIIRRDGTEIGRAPAQPVGRFGRPMFQSVSYHDTPERPLPAMRFVDATGAAGRASTYQVIAVNGAGLESEPSATVRGPETNRAGAPRNDSICQRDLKADLFFLSGDRFRGRLTATPENDMASAFIASRFERLGLKPVAGGSYDRGFNLVTASLGPNNRLGMDPNFNTIRLVPGQGYAPLPFSPEGERESTYRVAFVGFGIAAPERGHDDYQGRDVRRKIVLALEHEPGENDPKSPFDGLVLGEATSPLQKTLTAQERGALGILFVSDIQNHPEPENLEAFARSTWPEKPPRIPRYMLQDEVDRVRIPAARISTVLARSLLKGSGCSLEDLARSSEKPGQVPAAARDMPGVKLVTDVRHHVVPDRNVLAALEGGDPKLKDEWVIVSCHQDHNGAEGDRIYNGADDNGSGTVGMLEIAEAYALAARDGHRPKRSILFAAFNSEERGLLGSWAFVERPPIPLDRIVAVLNMDMVGRDEEVPERGGPRFRGLPVQSAESNHNAVNLLGYSRCSALARTIERANAGLGLTLKQVLDNNPSNLLRRSDQWPFLQKGVPAMFFHTGLHPDYHTTGDRPERINYPKMERIVRLVHQASWDLAQQPDRPRLDAKSSGKTGH